MEPEREISGATSFTAIFGDPVEHSRSPAMHNAAYAALALERRYLAFHVTPEHLAAALRAIPALGILGVNLTVPHKEPAAKMIRELSAEARLLRAVNCIVSRRGKLYGDNTDARGLERDLRGRKIDLADRLVIVIGAGGGAAAAVLCALRMRAARIAIANRTLSRAANLARRFAPMLRRRAQIEAHGLDALLDPAILGEAATVINATPMGLTTRGFARLDYSAAARDCLFYDLLYAAEPTAFLKPALGRGRPALDGAGMLVGQGEIAFELFNGVAPPAGVMEHALATSLGRS
ncbi:MAG TPA: shikimate dehydrogenase [Candidatus Binataceae bacterium]|nr:shikimate dehydrogenase [Candidatus Binataceae bacterium]